MGYVIPTSQLEQLKTAKTPEERQKAIDEMLNGYNRYRAGMRSGLFGLILGRWLFPKSGDIKTPMWGFPIPYVRPMDQMYHTKAEKHLLDKISE